MVVLGFEVGVLVRVFGVGVFSFQVFAVCGVGLSGFNFWLRQNRFFNLDENS